MLIPTRLAKQVITPLNKNKAPPPWDVWTGHMGNICAKTWVTLAPSQPTEKPMPWRTQTVKEQRIELVTLACKPEANISELARRFGVSRKTVYKWLNRDNMDNRSRRPKNSPKRTPHIYNHAPRIRRWAWRLRRSATSPVHVACRRNCRRWSIREMTLCARCNRAAG